MRPDDKRQRFDRRWETLSDFHARAASLCRTLARATRDGALAFWSVFPDDPRVVVSPLEGGRCE